MVLIMVEIVRDYVVFILKCVPVCLPPARGRWSCTAQCTNPLNDYPLLEYTDLEPRTHSLGEITSFVQLFFFFFFNCRVSPPESCCTKFIFFFAFFFFQIVRHVDTHSTVHRSSIIIIDSLIRHQCFCFSRPTYSTCSFQGGRWSQRCLFILPLPSRSCVVFLPRIGVQHSIPLSLNSPASVVFCSRTLY